MTTILRSLLAAVLSLTAAARSGPPEILPVEGDVDTVHDPAIIRQGSTYYIFSTNGRPGNLIPIRCSTDLRHWRLCGHVFDKLPDWASEAIPRARAPWAPDISFYGGRYHLYYAVSTFGSNESVIGLATNKTLDSQSPDYQWVDEGMVVRSHKEDNWNAIDPNFAMDKDGRAWLNWGSFWSGIKMRRIDPATGKFSAEDATLYSLARRPRPNGSGGAIEAPFLFRHGGYWYLFVSFDQCCRGANSTYRVAVGRSRNITGPYLDRDGKPMMDGGGTPVISSTSGQWRGPGHEAVLRDGSTDYLVFHAYKATSGTSALQISTIQWDHGWPKVGTLP